MVKFPADFMIGAATAAHQVEGHNINSDFWAMEHVPNSVYKEPSLDAVDHYDRFAEDIELLKNAGCNTYRFSIEWARIEPAKGEFDKSEIEHYRQVLNFCHQLNITPIVTLHHFSSPKWLITEGGWESETTIEHFGNYCRYVITELGQLIAVPAGEFAALFPPQPVATTEVSTNDVSTTELWGRHATDILDTQLPRPMAGFEVAITGPSGLKLFSNASVITSKMAGEKGATVTRLELDEASGLILFGGDLQLAEATADGKTLRLLASGQLPARSVEEAAQFAARHYAQAARTLKKLDGEAATSFPQTVTMALADYPYYSLNMVSMSTLGMVDASVGGPEARDVHFLSKVSVSSYFGAEIDRGKNGNIQLRTGQYWLDYSAKRREIRNARMLNLNAQYTLNNFFQAYNELKLVGGKLPDRLFEPVSSYFLNGTPNQVYDLMNTIYSQYGIESVYDVIKLVYDSIGTEQLIEDSDEQMEALLRGYLQRKMEGGQ
ncbi:family 1 glycosylhydrolase [Paenibacillus odorifer]|uniref:Glycoside hydrolase family 1 n=1 Tax=Paenibacillus odorifer TaxID=189426 RepID=A0AAD0KFL5_9BACL|nr:family 1 glycosylhydrolase [Paenibacillus odorifer]AWV32390.1 hypothetical protein CD191_07055 [Paenibacillus odorifer]